jgi:LmbE family N-acetylglucosaminyl deacetylase
MATTLVCHEEVPKIALGVAAHPDDLDFSAAGTVACWTAQGTEVYYLILTNGNKGSADLSADPDALTEIRREEQREAARILGVRDVFFCDYDDGCLSVSMDVKRDIARVIRKIRPDTVITMDPAMLYDVERGFINHPDHRSAGQATLDAVYPLARDHLSFPELYYDEGLEPHNVSTVLLTNFQNHNCYIDISATFDKKLQALAAHSSQIPSLASLEDMMRDFAHRTGQKYGVEYAEAYLRVQVR